MLESLATDSSKVAVATVADFGFVEVAADVIAAVAATVAFATYSMLAAHSVLKLAYENALIALCSITKGDGKDFGELMRKVITIKSTHSPLLPTTYIHHQTNVRL